MSWAAASDPESGVSAYRIYRDTVSGGAKTMIAEVSGTAYTDSATGPNTTYHYEVSAVNGAGTEGSRSNEANVLTGDDPPAAPTGLISSPGDQQVALEWQDNTVGRYPS